VRRADGRSAHSRCPLKLPFRTLEWLGDETGRLSILEQTRLPNDEQYIELSTLTDVVSAIHRLAVRGAPAIGCAAAYGVVVGLRDVLDAPLAEFDARLEVVARALIAARPTAVNLAWAVRRVKARAARERAGSASSRELVRVLLEEARAIESEDAAQCLAMGRHGAALLGPGARVLTHCNAGALATAGIGTALAPIYVAHFAGRGVSVHADETRPLLQGARITTWELARAGVPVTLGTDGMAARVMSEGRVDCVFVGSDRIARNGDVCNKIGTYAVAIAAREHGLPFYVVAPLSTFDPDCPSGAAIPIEERDAREITEGALGPIAPRGVAVYNPAFDVTPARFVTAIVTEHGVLERPDSSSIEHLLRRAGRIL
jgi:methylthioribose-1-phosphate isomerase